MKIQLALLPEVRQSKILASFVLNPHLFSFFRCLFTFLLEHFIVLFEISFASANLKRICIWISFCKKQLRYQEVLVIKFTTSRSVIF